MSEVSVKLAIANRTYPITVQDTEEELIRNAAKLINEHIKNLQENYGVKDAQDLIAMAALQIASKNLHKKSAEEDQKTVQASLTDELTEIDQLLNTLLNKIH